MRIDAITTFPAMYDSIMGESMMKRAQEKGLLQFQAHDLRDWAQGVHRKTDDYPYGGGCGLVMMCDPIFKAVEDVLGFEPDSLPGSLDRKPSGTKVIFMAPHGIVFDDACATRLSGEDRLVFVCGHYEGIDERAYCLADEVISIGDYVLTGGELASMVVIDAVVRKIEGVLGAAEGAQSESFVEGLLEYPQYTRPADYRGMAVPEVLLSGHHAHIEAWRRGQSLKRTEELRPDLLSEIAEAGSAS